MKWYWLDTRWACGSVLVAAGVIIDGAPIFRRLVGQDFDSVVRRGHYRYEELR